VADSCKRGSEPSATTKGRKFLDQLNDYQLLTKNYSPWSYSQSVQKENEICKDNCHIFILFFCDYNLSCKNRCINHHYKL
jgi:hypothetical protein